MKEAFFIIDLNPSDDENNDEKAPLLYLCRFCGKRYPEIAFSASALRERRYRCRRCAVKHTIKYQKKRSPFAVILDRLRRAERRRGHRLSRLLEESDIKKIVETRHPNVKKKDIDGLRVIRFWNDFPWSSDNCVVLPTKQAHSHAHCKNPLKLEYPSSLIQEMEKWKKNRESV